MPYLLISLTFYSTIRLIRACSRIRSLVEIEIYLSPVLSMLCEPVISRVLSPLVA
jgi:hypothetical protein